MSRSRPVSDGGFLPIPHSEILAWTLLYRISLQPWEIDVLTNIDDLWLEIVRKKTIRMEDLTEENPDA